MVYRIRIQGHLGDQWTEWFEGLAITREHNGSTVLTGLVVDQAALHGLLRKVRDLGMPLLSVNRVTSSLAEISDIKETHQCRAEEELENGEDEQDHHDEEGAL